VSRTRPADPVRPPVRAAATSEPNNPAARRMLRGGDFRSHGAMALVGDFRSHGAMALVGASRPCGRFCRHVFAGNALR
jgi:hypothetical protein